MNSLIETLLNSRSAGFTIAEYGFMNQGEEARGSKLNASIGVALTEQGDPSVLSSLTEQLNIEDDALLYSGCYGLPELRGLWAGDIRRKNPGIRNCLFSNPVVTAGLTQGLNLAGSLFLSPGDKMIFSGPAYENYLHIFGNFFQAEIAAFHLHHEGRLNIEGLDKQISASGEVVRILLNFPNNPLGYSPTQEDAKQLKSLLEKHTREGKKILLILDDAYFGLFYKKDVLKESLFSYLADLHENLLIMKIDGSSKEYFAWGLRIGFVSFQSKGFSAEDYKNLEDRAAAVIRATVSNVSRLAQTMMIKVLENPDTQKEKEVNDRRLAERFQELESLLEEHVEYRPQFTPEPFNSGYFFCIRLRQGINAHTLRRQLRKESVGLIAPTENHLRIAYSSLNSSQLPLLFDKIYQGCLNYEKLLTES